MAQSLSKIYLHMVFHIKTTSPQIDNEHLERVHNYIGQLVNSTGCQTVRVGGTNDHIHIVCLLSRDVTVSNLVEETKRNSSRWIKTLSPKYRLFGWQSGYGVFSVSQSVVNKVIEYVSNQQEHHKRVSFHDEYLQFLKLHNIDFNEKYVLSD
ncbi:MAG: transposase [Bacteroidaceae bacterium]|nr:transposase [Bacteroidaceae bacterium]